MSEHLFGRPEVTAATSNMVPLMTRVMYGRFLSLSNEVERQDGAAAHIFVPVMPDHGSEATTRILFIGQATRGWASDDVSNYDAARLRAEDLVRYPLAKSGFWQVIKQISREIEPGMDRSVTPDLSRFIGWSNLLKIGHPTRNPEAVSWDAQAELCVEQLKYEIDFMQPTAVILLTRNLAQEQIVEPIFGSDGWKFDTKEEDRVAWKTLGRLIVWLNHPRNMGPKGYRAASVAKAIELISGHDAGSAESFMDVYV